MRQWLRENKIQMLHTFDAPSNAFGIPVARLAGIPVALASQRSYRSLLKHPVPGGNRVTDALMHGIVVNCKAIRDHLMEDEGVAEKHIHLCYNGIDLDRFQPKEEPKPEMVRDAEVVIGTLCALRPEKGLETLVEGFARMRGRERAKLLVVGGGTMRERMEAQAAELSIAQQVVFAGEQRDVPPWMRAIDIFVLPSLSEALSNSLMEAMACGCCAVASRVGGNPELVVPGETGALFEARDAAGLAEILTRLASDEQERKRLARAGCEFLHANFSLAASVARMSSIYDEILSGRR
jgi:glycosyltransferase involved in cell wall biosynthesis